MIVRVYRNVTKNCYSIQFKKFNKWLVKEHSNEILLKYAVFKISKSGRQRVLETKSENVHAFVYGHLTTWQEFERLIDKYEDLVDIRYNPYENSSFLTYDKDIIKTARVVVGQNSGQLTGFGINETGKKYILK